MSRITVGPMTAFIGIGLLGVGLMSMVLPYGVLGGTMSHDNPWAPLTMTGVALPAYATPMVAMSQLGSMFQHGNSVGAAFILLCFGAGMNLGLLAWMWWHYGWKKLGIWFGIMLLIVIGISYGVEGPLYPKAIEASDHSHAFDRYCSPYRFGTVPTGGFPADIIRRLKLETQTHELFGIAALGFLATCGGLLRFFDPDKKLDQWLNEVPPTKKDHGRFDIILPAPRDWSMRSRWDNCSKYRRPVFCVLPRAPKKHLKNSVWHPSSPQVAAISGNSELCLHWIPMCEGWNKRLIVGIYLRNWTVDKDLLAASKHFATELEALEHMFQHRSFPSAVRRQALAVETARRDLAEALRRTGMIDSSQ